MECLPQLGRIGHEGSMLDFIEIVLLVAFEYFVLCRACMLILSIIFVVNIGMMLFTTPGYITKERRHETLKIGGESKQRGTWM